MLKLEIKTDGVAFTKYDSEELSYEGKSELARLLQKFLYRLCRYAACIINDNREDAEEKFIDTVVEIINKV